MKTCDFCGSPKGYPFRAGEVRNRPDGSAYYLPTIKHRCWPCKERMDKRSQEIAAESTKRLQAVLDKAGNK